MTGILGAATADLSNPESLFEKKSDLAETDEASCSKTQPSIKASADIRLAGLSPHMVGGVSGFWNGMVDAERTVADMFLILAGWVNEEQQGVIN